MKKRKKKVIFCKKNNTKKLFGVFFVLVIIFLIIGLIYLGFLRTKSAISTWSQNDWSGGAEPGSITTNLTGWNKFDSSTNLDYSTANQLKLNQTFEAWGAGGVRATESALPETTPRSVASGTGVIVAFLDTTSPNTLRVQRIDADGNRTWPSVGTKDGIVIDQSTNISSSQIPKIVSDGSDGAIVVWENNSLLYARKIDSSGVLQWGGNIQVSNLNCVNHDFDAVSDNLGGIDVAFNKGNDDIQGQRILSDGSRLWGTGPGYDDGIEIHNWANPVSYISLATDGINGFYLGYIYRFLAYRINKWGWQ